MVRGAVARGHWRRPPCVPVVVRPARPRPSSVACQSSEGTVPCVHLLFFFKCRRETNKKLTFFFKLKDILDNLVSGACKTVDLSTVDAHLLGLSVSVCSVCVCVCVLRRKIRWNAVLVLIRQRSRDQVSTCFLSKEKAKCIFFLLFASDLWTPLVTGPRTARYTSMAFR